MLIPPRPLVLGLVTLRDRRSVIIRGGYPGNRGASPSPHAAGEDVACFFGRAGGIVTASLPPEPTAFTSVGYVAIDGSGDGDIVAGSVDVRGFAHGLRCQCTLRIDPDWRGIGLDVQLMRLAIEAAARLGMRHVHARGAADDRALADLSHALGFRAGRMPEAEDGEMWYERTLPAR